MHAIRETCTAALARVAAGDDALRVLDALARGADAASGPGSAASVFALDARGRLRSAAGPRLPVAYLRAVDGIRPDPDLGTCAAAAATGRVVVTPNFMDCSRWRELRHLPLALGFVGAWSRPILSSVDGRVLGTFGTYFRDIRVPSEDEQAAVLALAEVAARALEPGIAESELERLFAAEPLPSE